MQVAAESAGRSTGTALFIGSVLGIATVVGIFTLLWAFPATKPVYAAPQNLSSFESYSQLQQFITANAKSAQQYNRYGVFFGGMGVGMKTPMTFNALAAVPAASDNAGAQGAASASFTQTNVQVQGVDEPDRVKTDGSHLFVSSGSNVTIINAYPPNSTAVDSVIRLANATVQGLEIAPNRLLVIDSPTTYFRYPVEGGIAVPMGVAVVGYGYGGTSSVSFLLYDTSNLASPKLISNVTIPGDYVAARLADGFVYGVVQQSSYTFSSSGNATATMPTVFDNGVKATISPSSVYYTSNKSQISYYTMVASIEMATGNNSVLSVLTGPSSTVYVSLSNIYVVYTNYPDLFSTHGILGDVYTGGAVSVSDVQQAQNSTILRASYSSGKVLVAAAGIVPGSVLNQFSLDEYNGYFRVATGRFAIVSGTPVRSNDVYVLDQSMNQVSALTNFSPDENIYAVRFVGDLGYVVTFEQIDPLFVISFQDINHPTVLSALKVSGYSDYLHPLPGGYLIGVGKDAVPSSTIQNVAFYTSLKLSLFRVFANGTSTQVSKLLIGDRGTDSPVLTDHLAFTWDQTRNVTVIPLTLYMVSGNQTTCSGCPPPYGDPVWQGVYVIKVDSTGFTVLGKVSQYPAGQNFGDSPNYNLQVDRSVIIGDYLYTVSQSEVMVSAFGSFSTVAAIPLG